MTRSAPGDAGAEGLVVGHEGHGGVGGEPQGDEADSFTAMASVKADRAARAKHTTATMRKIWVMRVPYPMGGFATTVPGEEMKQEVKVA